MQVSSPRGHYGYNHRGRILKANQDDGTYAVEISSLAPNLSWGPIPSLIPGLLPGDPVLVCQLGTTRGELVIVGKIPGELPDFTDIPGLSAALAAKADEDDLVTAEGAITANTSAITGLGTRLTTDEAAILANGTAITGLGTRMTSAEGRLTADEATLASHTGTLATHTSTLATLSAERNYSHGNDFEINHDFLSTAARAVVTSTLTMSAGHGFYAKMRTHRAVNLNVIKVCLATAGAGGSLKIAVYAGPDTSALVFQATATLTLAAGRQDWVLSSPVALAVNDYLAIGLLGTGQTTVSTVVASPSVNTTLINQDATVLTAVSTTASTLTALPTAPLNLATLTGYNMLGQIPWIAASP